MHLEFYCYSVESTFFHSFFYFTSAEVKRDIRPRFGVVVMVFWFLQSGDVDHFVRLVGAFSLRVLPGF